MDVHCPLNSGGSRRSSTFLCDISWWNQTMKAGWIITVYRKPTSTMDQGVHGDDCRALVSKFSIKRFATMWADGSAPWQTQNSYLLIEFSSKWRRSCSHGSGRTPIRSMMCCVDIDVLFWRLRSYFRSFSETHPKQVLLRQNNTPEECLHITMTSWFHQRTEWVWWRDAVTMGYKSILEEVQPSRTSWWPQRT